MRRSALAVLFLAGGLVALWRLSRPTAAEHAAWVADLELLERHTATAYANLGERLEAREISPRELDAAARAALASAGSRAQAATALQRFVAAFDDAHFRAEAPIGPVRRWLRQLFGKRGSMRDELFSLALDGAQACAALGAHDRRGGPLDWSALPKFQPLDLDPATHPLPAGLLARAEGPPLALLRIGLFDPLAHPQFCAAEWDRFRARRAATSMTCDRSCREEFGDQLEHALLDRLDAQLAELAAGGATELLVDLTGNGGGSGIVGPMMRRITPRPIPPRASGFIRHPHSVQRLSAMAEDLRLDLARADLTDRQRGLLDAALARLDGAIAEAATTCDLSQLWSLPRGAQLPCENIGHLDPLAPEATPADLTGLASAWLAGAAEPSGPSHAWPGELVALVDRRTASAAEDFAASLQDAGAARIAGERTMGVGCGYTNGGVTLTLPATGLTVRAPDCVRYRADGSNEAEGVEPELAIAWHADDDRHARARRVIADPRL